MLANQDMKAERFLRWHRARQKVARIRDALVTGYTVQITTYTRYTAKHADMFKATKGGAYVQHGSQWLCFDGAAVTILGPRRPPRLPATRPAPVAQAGLGI